MEKTEAESVLVSVIVVNFNAGDLLTECVESVMRSTLPLQLIVCDNASTDHSLDHLQQRQFPVQVIRNPRNLGFAAAVNRGLALAKADILLILNPDCLIKADTLESILVALRPFPNWGMAGCRILDPDGSEQRGCRRHLPTVGLGLNKALGRNSGPVMDLHRQAVPDAPQPVEAISGAFMLIKKAALDVVGAMDEGYFLHCEDLDWCKRFHDKGFDIIFVPGVEIVHHQGSCSADRPVKVNWHKHRGMLRYYRKYLAAKHNPLLSVAVTLAVTARFLLTSVKILFVQKGSRSQ